MAAAASSGEPSDERRRPGLRLQWDPTPGVAVSASFASPGGANDGGRWPSRVLARGPSSLASAGAASTRRAGPALSGDRSRPGADPILPAVSRLPVSLPRALEPAFLAAFDPPGKLVRTIDALGPVADRDVLVVDAADGPIVGALAEEGARLTHEALTDPFRLAAADGSSDVVLGLWSAFRGVSAADLAEVDRVLRPEGRHLVVHDYGRDDVSRLYGERPEYGPWSHRAGPFLAGGFRVRVVHCFWEFESVDAATVPDRGVRRGGQQRRGQAAPAASLVQRRRLPSLPTMIERSEPAPMPRAGTFVGPLRITPARCDPRGRPPRIGRLLRVRRPAHRGQPDPPAHVGRRGTRAVVRRLRDPVVARDLAGRVASQGRAIACPGDLRRPRQRSRRSAASPSAALLVLVWNS